MRQFSEVTRAHLLELDAAMLPLDRRELELLTDAPTLELLEASVAVSTWSKTLIIDGEVACVFGVAGELAGWTGAPWMIGSTLIERRPLVFLRACRHWVGIMRMTFPRLENDVWAGNTPAVRWLRWLGFELEEPRPHGQHGAMFHPFSMGDARV